MKRVAIDCRLIDKTGIGRYIRSLLEEYKRLDPPFEFILLGDSQKLGSVGLGEVIHFDEPIYSIREHLFFPNLKADLLHCPHYNAPLFYGGKLVVTVHDVVHFACPTFFKGKLKRALAKFVLKRALERCSRFITVSKFSLSEVERIFNYSGLKGVVIYPGVEMKVFYRRNELEIEEVKKRFGINGRYMIFVGNLKPHKNITGVIMAFRSLRHEFEKLVIVGTSEGLRTRLEEFDRLIDENIVHIERTDDNTLSALYSAAELLLFPSFYEGFGLPALESLACGTVPVLSDIPVFREIFDSHAIFVDPRSIGSIVDGVTLVVRNGKLKARLLENIDDFLSAFSWKSTAQKTLNVYAEVVGL